MSLAPPASGALRVDLCPSRPLQTDMHVEAEIEEAVVLPAWYTGGGAMAIAALLVLVHLVTKGGKGTG